MSDEINNKRLDDLINVSPEKRTREYEKMLIEELKKASLLLPIEFTRNKDALDNVKVGETYTTKEPLGFKPLTYVDENRNVHLFVFTNERELVNVNCDNILLIDSADIAEKFKTANFRDIVINPFNENGFSIAFKDFLRLFNDEKNSGNLNQKEKVNMTYNQAGFFVRDLNLSEDLINKYEIGQIIQERALVDSSNKIGKMITNCRFAIISNHCMDCSKFEDGTNWNLFTCGPNSLFKVLDIYEYKGKVQILLLHLFKDNWKPFIRDDTINQIVVNDSRRIFRETFNTAPVPELTSDRWLERCGFPVGLDNDGNFWEIE
ncbi:MAG: SseB family protein [Methanobrevibacter sp.]